MEVSEGAKNFHNWEKMKPLIPKLKRLGLEQFVRNYTRMRGRGDYPFKWGDEVEQLIVRVDDEAETVKLVLKATEVLEKLKKFNEALDEEDRVCWQTESGEFMAESTPGRPFGSSVDDLVKVEADMKVRREQINSFLGENEKVVTMTTYPLIGCEDFTVPALQVGPEDENPLTRSIFFHDNACSTSPAYRAWGLNMLARKGSKTVGNVPVYKDKNTRLPFRENFARKEDLDASKEGHIYLDSTWIAFSSCCLQTTFQLADLEQCKKVYDQLVAISPVLMAMSASSPFFRGFVSDVDTRWTMMVQCNDDRTREETKTVKSSRWDSAEMFLCENHLELNDVPASYDRKAFNFLVSRGVDEAVSRHVAHVWVRDPYLVSEVDVEESYSNFETMNNSVFQPVRFKPPPGPKSTIGWRCEFRVMEIQPSDFENAAFAAFVVLLVRAFAKFDVDLTTTLSGHLSNMDKAQKRDAVRTQKFSFPGKLRVGGDEKGEVVLMSADKIINGDGEDFIGLIGLVKEYLKSEAHTTKTSEKLDAYMSHLSGIASGETLTVAQKMRRFVEDHEDYTRNSVLNHKINYDMMKVLWDV